MGEDWRTIKKLLIPPTVTRGLGRDRVLESVLEVLTLGKETVEACSGGRWGTGRVRTT